MSVPTRVFGSVLGAVVIVCTSLTGVVTETARGQTNAEWLNAVSGDWDNAGRWSTPVYPNNGSPNAGDSYHAIINATGSPYSVEMLSGLTLEHLTLESADATLLLNSGDLTVNGNLNLNAGVFRMGDHGTANLRSATISGAGRIEVPNQEMIQLFDITHAGTIDLGNGARLSVRNELMLNGGTINTPGGLVELIAFSDASILGTGVINLTSGCEVTANGTIFTIGQDVDINVSGTLVEMYSNVSGNLISRGDITAISSDSNLTLKGVWENHGTIRFSQGSLDLAGNWINTGVIDTTGGGTLRMNDSQSWSNQGVIRIDQATQVDGNYTSDSVGGFELSGDATVSFRGTIDNTGRTMLVDSSWSAFDIRAYVNGGVVESADGSPFAVASGARLDNVDIRTDLLVPNRVGMINPVPLQAGTRILLGGGSSYSYIEYEDGDMIEGDGEIWFQTRTRNELKGMSGIGAGITIKNNLGDGQILGSDNPASPMTNHGTIWATNGRSITLNNYWANQGLLKTDSGSTLILDGEYSLAGVGTIENAGVIQLAGKVDITGTTLNYDGGSGVWELGDIQLTGGTLDTAPGKVWRIAGRASFLNTRIRGEVELDNLGHNAVNLNGDTRLVGGVLRLEASDINAKMTHAGFAEGEIIFASGESGIRFLDPWRLTPVTFGEDLVIRTGGGSGFLYPDWSYDPLVINEGLISAQHAGQEITIEFDLENRGTLEAINGASLAVQSLQGPAGNIHQDGSGSLTLKGDFDIDQSFTATSGNIAIGGTWRNSAPANLSQVELYIGGPRDASSAAFNISDSDVFIVGSMTTPELTSLAAGMTNVTLQVTEAPTGHPLGGGRRGRILNTGHVLDLADLPADFELRAGDISGGTVVASNGASLRVNGSPWSAYFFDVDLDVDVNASNGMVMAGNWVNRRTFTLTNGGVTLTGTNPDGTPMGVNNGLISATNSSVWVEDFPGGTGQIQITNGNLRLAGDATAAEVAAVNLTNSRVFLNLASLDNTGHVTHINQDRRWFLEHGAVENGTLKSDDGTPLVIRNNIVALHSVVLDTDVDLQSNLQVFGALSGHGEIVLNGSGAMVIPPKRTNGGDPLQIIDIAQGITVRTGTSGGLLGDRADGVNNHGKISARTPGTLLHVSMQRFENHGRMEAINGSTLWLDVEKTSHALPDETIVHNHGEVYLDNGTLNLDVKLWADTGSGWREFPGTFINDTGGTIVGAGTIALLDTVFINRGTIAPGPFVGTLAFDGDYEETETAKLLIKIFGTSAGLHDVLEISGSASLSGNLDLRPSFDLGQTPGVLIPIVTADTVDGQFATVSNVVLSDRLGLAARYNSTGVDLRLSVRGDSDFDDDVDITDFNLLATHFDPAGEKDDHAWAVGNFDGDADIDITDFNALASNFNPFGYDDAETESSAVAAADTDPGEIDLIVDIATGEVWVDGNNASISGFQILSGANSLVPGDLAPAVLATMIGAPTNSFYAEGAFLATLVNSQVSLGILYDVSIDGQDLAFEYTFLNDPNAVQGNVVYVPEPASLVLMGIGGLVALWRSRAA